MTEGNNDVSWALKILEREPDYEANLLSRNSHQLWCTFFGFLVPVFGNFMYKRPAWAGFQSHIFASVIGFGVGTWLKKRENDVLSKNDAILRDYIIRHPEDFPEPERKKWGELFVEWTPIR